MRGEDNRDDGRAVVELQGARKRYGEVEALRGVDLAIGPGGGRRDARTQRRGKTTSIAASCSPAPPTAGHARLFGLDPQDRRARSRVGVMLQESGVPGVLTVRELVDLFRAYYPRPLPAERVIAVAGLDDKSRARVNTLSGGQRQRLYFALAVCGDPEVLFLDEPTVGMDVEARPGVPDVDPRAGAGRADHRPHHALPGGGGRAGPTHRGHRPRRGHRGRRAGGAQGAHAEQARALRTTAALDAAVLDGLPVTSLERVGDRVRLLSAEPERVLRELFRRGVDVADLEVAGADLEEAFLALTTRRPERA